MKSIVAALLLSLALSACAALRDSSRGSTAVTSDGTASQDYGVRDATRDYPYGAAY